MTEPIPWDLRERAFRFTCETFNFCEHLSGNPGMTRHVAYQLFRAVSSIGANLEEEKAAYSRREFTSKNAISLKEAREAKYWLRVADDKSLGDPDARRRLLDEADQLVAILTTSVKHLQLETDFEP
jgi:four helix bundle protein